MNRWIRSTGRAPVASRHNAKNQQPATRPMIAEPLEGRVMMAAQLGSSSLINKFAGSTTGAPTSSTNVPVSTKPALVGPSGGLIENDDRISNAASKGLDFSVDSSISQPMDVDMYKFKVTKGQRVGFDIDRPQGSTLDSFLRIFDASGRELAVSDDDAAEFETKVTVDAAIDYTFGTAGTYYVAVSASGNDGFNAITGFGDVNGNSTGKYSLKVKKLPPPDTNDTIDEAELVSTEDFITGKIDARGDVDMFKFEVLEGQTLAFDMEALSVEGPNDTILRLFDKDGNELAISDDDLAPDEQNEPNFYGDAYIEYTFDEAGTYYIAVSGGRMTNTTFGNNVYDPITGLGDKEGQTGRYGLRITDPANYIF